MPLCLTAALSCRRQRVFGSAPLHGSSEFLTDDFVQFFQSRLLRFLLGMRFLDAVIVVDIANVAVAVVVVVAHRFPTTNARLA